MAFPYPLALFKEEKDNGEEGSQRFRLVPPPLSDFSDHRHQFPRCPSWKRRKMEVDEEREGTGREGVVKMDETGGGCRQRRRTRVWSLVVRNLGVTREEVSRMRASMGRKPTRYGAVFLARS